ncbi:MAG: hypothetical protein EOP87_03220 [Verrucomicrobiaceae bacterium]|nr:MAG: hypothetical protein EOP87_03220 [Verrucomicrobiaceae bacterium]
MKTSVARMLLAAGLLQPLLAQPPGEPPPPPNPVPGAGVQQQQMPQPGVMKPPAPAPTPIRLVLDGAPKLSTFTGAEMKFLLPHQDIHWSKSLESRGPLALTFASKGKAAPAVSVSQFNISFRPGDLTPRGEYYPAPPPAGPETPVKGAWITGTLPSAEVPALLAYFKIPPERADIWIKNEFWKDGGSLKLTGEVPGGKASLTLGGDLQDSTRSWVQIQLNWLEDEPTNPIPGGPPPRPRVTPSSRR